MNTESNSIDRLGTYIAAAAFEALGFAFREQVTSDFGIDAHVEARTGARGTGELLALQIKSGNSYFRERAPNGWRLRTDRWHAEYWLRHSLPVLVVHVDVEHRRVFWEAVTPSAMLFTDGGAKILIRRVQQVNAASLPLLRDLLSPLRALGEPVAEGSECRVFLDRGISGKEGWHTLARVLIRQITSLGCISGWDVVVRIRNVAEEEELSRTNEFGADGQDLVSIEIDQEHCVATYSVSPHDTGGGYSPRDPSWAAATADAILEHIMQAEGLLGDDDDE